MAKSHGEAAFLSVGGIIGRLIHANESCIRTTRSGISFTVTIVVEIFIIIIIIVVVVVVVAAVVIILAVIEVAVISRWRCDPRR